MPEVPPDTQARSAAEFLSDEWIAALDDRARRSAALASTGATRPFSVEVRVTGAPDGPIVFRLDADGTEARVRRGPAAAPTLIVTTDADTAAALGAATTNAQRALAAGRLTVRGSVGALAARADALAAVGDLFGSLPA